MEQQLERAGGLLRRRRPLPPATVLIFARPEFSCVQDAARRSKSRKFDISFRVRSLGSGYWREGGENDGPRLLWWCSGSVS